MTSSLKRLHIPTAPGLAALTLVANVWAQDGIDKPQDKTKKSQKPIEHIIVTAQKREQALFDVPMAVSAFNGDILDDMGAENLSDIAAATPGFSVSESGPGVQQLQMRGIASSIGKATVGYQLDNISLTSAADAQPDAATFDLASVEILRGPQGTLYGEGSMGGTVKLKTRRPVLDEWQFISQMSYFETESAASGKEANAALNIPLLDNAAARLVVGYTDLGGYIDQIELDKENHNTIEKLNTRLRVLWDITETLDINFMVLQQEIETGSSNAADENYEQRDRAPVGIDDESNAYSIDINWELPWFNLNLTNSFFDRDLLARFDGREGTIRGIADSIDDLAPLPDGIAEPLLDFGIDSVPTIFGNENEAMVSELRLHGSWQDRLYWTAGVFYKTQDESVRVAGDINFHGGIEVTAADVNQRTDSKVKSIFGQVEYDWFSWLNTAIGARKFEEDLIAINTGELLSESADSRDVLHFEATTPRFTVTFRLPEQLWGIVDQSMIYVTYSEGFRSGGANIRRSDDQVSATYGPDFLENREIGSKMIFLDNRLSLELSYYETEWYDVQVESVESPNGFAEVSSIINAGDTEGRGYDWALMLRPLEYLTLTYSGSHIDTEYVTDTRSKRKGDPVDFVPEDQYSLSATLGFQWADGWPGMARVDYNKQDSSSQTSRLAGIDIESDPIEMAHVRLGVERPQWQLYLFGRNLTDNRGALSPALEERQARARPPHYGVQFNVEF